MQQSARPAYDEAYAADGTVRPHWQYLLGSLEAFGEENRASRKTMVERALRDDGASYNDYRNNTGGRDWDLDPVPLLLDSAEWSRIEAGVRERAELLDLVLRDLYGQRELVTLGIIPAEVVFGYRGFLRACQGISLPGEQQLIQYAADLIRGPDGAMQIISDRTQVPSGMGYALENRLVMSRVFPSLFRDSHVHRLSRYFNSLRLKLNSLGPNGGVPRVVMLTPGAYNETYFEHMFLANHLGYSLVQGNDLLVRDGYVWLKTLKGLNRIDVILRRVDDEFCDPVELRPDSQLGVPGLLEVIRAGHVVVANPLGCGVLENSALLKYLPAAAGHFLGRELSLDAVPTRWCGNQEDLQYTLANLEHLIVKTTFHGSASRTIYGAELTKAELGELSNRIKSGPADFVAQDYVEPSLTPVWGGNGQSSRPAILRSFAVAGESSYIVMPGGLTRVAGVDGDIEISNRAGSPSKDTWVLASEPEKVEPATSAGIERGLNPVEVGSDLPSRVVENLFWLGRYSERAESALRLLRIVFIQLGGATPPSPAMRQALLRAVTQLTCTYPGFMDESLSDEEPMQELLSVVLDHDRPGSVANTVYAMLSAVDQVKDYMSVDTQRILNDLYDHMLRLPQRLQVGQGPIQVEELDALITSMLALTGLIQESMMRGQGWHFLQAGRRIERVLQSLSLLRSMWVQQVSSADEELLLEVVLQSMDSLMTYRRLHQRHLDVGSALQLLLLDVNNPRSTCFQLEALERHLAAMPISADGARLPHPERLLLEAASALKLADMGKLAELPEGRFLRSELDQLLSRNQHLLAALASAISDECFDHAAGPRPLGHSTKERAP